MPTELSAALPRAFNLAEYFLDRPAREHPDRIAILGEPTAVRYSELAALANRAGNALGASGCQAGERVLIALPDSAEFMATFFGSTKIGAVAVPVNSASRVADYGCYVADSGARIAVVHASALTEFLPATEGTAVELVVLVGGLAGAAERSALGVRFVDWDDWIRAASGTLDPHPTSATDTAFFLFTSGSGGKPKAA